MSQKEQARLKVLNCVLAEQMTVGEAATIMGLSERHTWRILAAYRKEGASSLAHGNRGRRPANTTPEGVRKQVIAFARGKYGGFNHCHLTEMLAETEGLRLSRSTVRAILVRKGINSPRRRRPPRHRLRRQRMSQEGMLLQVDGSYHDWLQGRGPWLTLLIVVDDATGKVVQALFREREDTRGYFLLFGGAVQAKGLPLAAYSDRHNVFQSSQGGQTQFGRALAELGIGQIFARSPQAKGRVERAAGTFQDRLVSELRLAGAGTLAEANRVLAEFVPRFNGRFGVVPGDTEIAYRPVPPELDLNTIFCFKHTRKAARDNTVKYKGRTLQLLPERGEHGYAGRLVELREHVDGSFTVCYQGRIAPVCEAPQRPSILRGIAENPNVAAVPEITDLMQAEHAWAEDGICNASRGQRHRQPNAPRGPTPRMMACWDAIRSASEEGLSIRAIANRLGVARQTVRKYLRDGGPTAYKPRQSNVVTTEPPAETEGVTDKIAYQLT